MFSSVVAEFFWAASREFVKLHEYRHPHPPLVPLSPELLDRLSEEEMDKVNRCMSLARGKWARIDWPLIPLSLAEKMEINADWNLLMQWEIGMKRDIFHLQQKSESAEDVVRSSVFQSKIRSDLAFSLAYSEGESAAIHHYRSFTALNYLVL